MTEAVWLFSLHATQYSQCAVALYQGWRGGGGWSGAVLISSVSESSLCIFCNLNTKCFHRLVIAVRLNGLIIATPPVSLSVDIYLTVQRLSPDMIEAL